MIYGPPLPQLPDAERAAIRAELAKTPWRGIHERYRPSMRWWRWVRFVTRHGGKKQRGYAREWLILDQGLLHRFDQEEAVR